MISDGPAYLGRKEGAVDAWVAANDAVDEAAANIAQEDGLSLAPHQRQRILTATLNAISRVVAFESRRCTCGTKPNGGHLVTCPAVAAPGVVRTDNSAVIASLTDALTEARRQRDVFESQLLVLESSQSEQIARLNAECERRMGAIVDLNEEISEGNDKVARLTTALRIATNMLTAIRDHTIDSLAKSGADAALASLPSTPETPNDG